MTNMRYAIEWLLIVGQTKSLTLLWFPLKWRPSIGHSFKPNKASQCHSFTFVPDHSRSIDINATKSKIFIRHSPSDPTCLIFFFQTDNPQKNYLFFSKTIYFSPRMLSFRSAGKSATNHLLTGIWSQMESTSQQSWMRFLCQQKINQQIIFTMM